MIEKVSKVKQAILFACCLAATGCKQAPQATVESGYKVITLAPTDRTLSSTYSATIRGRQDIEIYPQVGGTLTQVCVSEGERVKRGQSLFVINAMCPWCLVLMFSTTVQFMALSHATVAVQDMPSGHAGLRKYYRLNFDLMVDVVWIVALIVVILVKDGPMLFA